MTVLAQVGIFFLSFVLLSILFWLGLIWLKKHQLHRALDLLLDNIQDRQGPRADSLTRRAMDKFKMNQADAQALSQTLLAAEKLFIQQFIEQQLHKKSLEHFYDQLCDLLDSYLGALPRQQAGDKAKPQAPAVETAPQSQPDTGVTPEPEMIQDADTPPVEENWGDVFD